MWPADDELNAAMDTARAAAYLAALNQGAWHARALELAKEAVQTALARFGADLSRGGRARGYFRNWLARVAVNGVRSQLRCERIACRHEGALRERLREQRRRAQAVSESLRGTLLKLIDDLPEQDRRLLECYFEVGMTLDQLADELQIGGETPNARRLRVFRRLNRIYDQMRSRIPDEDYQEDREIVR